MPITFSVRQGDPIAMLLYIIQLQPFLLRLEEVLPGVAFPDFDERVEAYVDNVVVVGEDENDLLIVDAIFRQFEAISGAILNRSHKTAILGLGGWGAGLAERPGLLPGSVPRTSSRPLGWFLPQLWPPQSPSLGRAAWAVSRRPFMAGGPGGCPS